MRTFPARYMSQNNVPIITPYFIGFTRGIDGNSKRINATPPTTSVDMIKCLRSPMMSSTPMKPVENRYQVSQVSNSKSMTLPPPRKQVYVQTKKYAKINSSVY